MTRADVDAIKVEIRRHVKDCHEAKRPQVFIWFAELIDRLSHETYQHGLDVGRTDTDARAALWSLDDWKQFQANDKGGSN